MRNMPLVVVLVFVNGLLSVGCSSPVKAGSPFQTVLSNGTGIIDTEVHYVDFLQRTSGIDQLLAAMNRFNISAVALMGLPVIKKWGTDRQQPPNWLLEDGSPLYYFSLTDAVVAEAVLNLPEQEQQRFYPFVCGFNPTDLSAYQYIERMLEMYPGFWRGIGEILTRHDHLSYLTEGERARANHPALHKVYKLAARHHMPVLLHSNISAPGNHQNNYLPELKDALATNPDTRFIWAHGGLSETLKQYQSFRDYHKLVESMLDQYPNLTIDLSWTIVGTQLYGAGGGLNENWVALIREKPGRFILGSDVVGNFGGMGSLMSRFDTLFEALPPEAVTQLKSGNFLKLVGEGSGNQP